MNSNILSLILPALITALIVGLLSAALSGSLVLAIVAFIASANFTVIGLALWLAMAGIGTPFVASEIPGDGFGSES